MKSLTFRGQLAALSLVAFVPALPFAQQEEAPPPREPGGGALQRVEPEPLAAESKDGLPELFAREFDRARWLARLTAADLEQRERGYDALLQRARLDPLARVFLEELARDPDGGEAAWTARLALRELGRARFPLTSGLATPGPFGVHPLGAGPSLQQWMKELFAQDGLALRLPQGPSGAPGSGRSVQIEQDEDGAHLRIHETVDGEGRTRSYAGASLEEILRAHPELESELGGLAFLLHASPRPRGEAPGIALVPQALSRPRLTDRLGVVVSPLDAERARELGLVHQGVAEGLRVERAYPETYAQLLGVRAGDVLVELDGVRLRSSDDITRVMRARAPDQPLTLSWLDELGQRQTKTWRPGPEKR